MLTLKYNEYIQVQSPTAASVEKGVQGLVMNVYHYPAQEAIDLNRHPPSSSPLSGQLLIYKHPTQTIEEHPIMDLFWITFNVL